MKGKLITDGKNNYSFLNLENQLVASTMSSAITDTKLSLKNCQAIERGYDLEEMSENYSIFQSIKFGHNTKHSEEAFKDGFDSALELMNDDVFNWLEKKGYLSDDKDIIKKEYAQQTEWDVEIVEFTSDDLKSINKEWHKLGEPKLDSDGCLILKKI